MSKTLAPRSRAGIIMLGLLVACLIAGVVLSAASYILRPPSTEPSLRELSGTLISIVALVFFVVLIPAAIVIMHTESDGIRSVRYYGLAGALVGLFGPVFYSVGITSRREYASFFLLLTTIAAAGAIAGVCYWAIAGRSAGSNRVSALDHAKKEE
jgi:cytochrome bd-type quinol oxidase subunit 2